MGKDNVVADALSRKCKGCLAHLEAYQRPLAKEVHRVASLGVRLADSSDGWMIVKNRAELSLVVEVKAKQYSDPLLVQLKVGIHKHKTMAFSLGMDDDTLRYQRRLYVPNKDGLRERIMTEAHTSRLSKLSTSECRAPEAQWVGTEHRNSNIEVANDQH
ncbi:uncharacterized protein [Nicotiana tomentosiformis]|uniref:uncharacterized protein n=1 Tax=Nicotiana tomentosiformis TaxID=4098 RepID=UPI00388C689A